MGGATACMQYIEWRWRALGASLGVGWAGRGTLAPATPRDGAPDETARASYLAGCPARPGRPISVPLQQFNAPSRPVPVACGRAARHSRPAATTYGRGASWHARGPDWSTVRRWRRRMDGVGVGRMLLLLVVANHASIGSSDPDTTPHLPRPARTRCGSAGLACAARGERSTPVPRCWSLVGAELPIGGDDGAALVVSSLLLLVS